MEFPAIPSASSVQEFVPIVFITMETVLVGMNSFPRNDFFYFQINILCLLKMNIALRLKLFR